VASDRASRSLASVAANHARRALAPSGTTRMLSGPGTCPRADRPYARATRRTLAGPHSIGVGINGESELLAASNSDPRRGERNPSAGLEKKLGSRRPWPRRQTAPGTVVACGNRARTQNGHIRNDTRDVSRRICTACNGPICRRKCVASDRACTGVTPMVRRGSRVRVRERAYGKGPQTQAFSLGASKSSRALVQSRSSDLCSGAPHGGGFDEWDV
jgi:hypothetical protein